jgi:hypothetical protein
MHRVAELSWKARQKRDEALARAHQIKHAATLAFVLSCHALQVAKRTSKSILPSCWIMLQNWRPSLCSTGLRYGKDPQNGSADVA